MERLECVLSLVAADRVGHVAHKARVMRPKVDPCLRLLENRKLRRPKKGKKVLIYFLNNMSVLIIFELNSI